MRQSVMGRRIVKITTPNYWIEKRPLGENEYLVPVSYRKLEFSIDKRLPDGSFDPFDGNNAWQLHPSCAEIDQIPGNRVMRVKRFNDYVMAENAIAKMAMFGYRPATHLELYAFSKVYPEQQCQFDIVALGSYARVGGGGDRFIMTLEYRSDKRCICFNWFGGDMPPRVRFLFVRRQVSRLHS